MKTLIPSTRRENLAGKQFFRLTALEYAGDSHWTCSCECGRIVTVDAYKLKTGRTVSCGCFRNECSRNRATIHGQSNTPTWRVWNGMLRRCYDHKFHAYDRYGGRGIGVVDRWRGESGFANFLHDMGERPAGKSLDRFPDNSAGYGPDNCRWATPKEQSNNRRPRRDSRKTNYNGGVDVYGLTE